MKHIKLLLACLLLTVVFMPAQSQTADVTFGKNDYYRSYTKDHNADTIEGAEELGKIFMVNKPFEYNYQLQASADSMGQEGSLAFKLHGSVEGETYYPIDTITWHMSTSDTTVLFESSSAVRWRWLKPVISGNSSSDKARLKNLYLSITGCQ